MRRMIVLVTEEQHADAREDGGARRADPEQLRQEGLVPSAGAPGEAAQGDGFAKIGMKALTLKRHFVSLAILLDIAVPALADWPAGTLSPKNVTYDRFKDKTTVLIEVGEVNPGASGRVTMFVGLSYKGNTTAGAPEAIGIHFRSGNRFDGASRVGAIALAGGKRIEMGESRDNAIFSSGVETHVVSFQSSAAQMVEMATGPTLEIQVGRRELGLSSSQMATMRAIAESLLRTRTRGAGPPTAPL